MEFPPNGRPPLVAGMSEPAVDLGGLGIEGVLAGHRVAGWREVKPERYLRVCSCGHDLDTRDIEGTHRAHVAAVLREQIAAAQAEAWRAGTQEGFGAPEGETLHDVYALNPYHAAQVAPSRVPGEES
jgi:hypothetical protein